MKQLLIKIHHVLSGQFGVDPQRFLRSLRGLPAFLRDWRQFRRCYSGRLFWMPCLHDRYEEGGAISGEYFWQDLLVARWIYAAQPDKHVDVGSRVDGFVAHVASFREIEVVDVRPLTVAIPNVIFKQADMMQFPDDSLGYATREGYCDSISCLHALEHFGLGRYGDPVDPHGHERGLRNMAAMLKSGGSFYLSVPIGRERVEFNAHRVFDPHTIVRLAESNGLALRSLTVVGRGGQVNEVSTDADTLQSLADLPYQLGLFTFLKALNETDVHDSR